MNEHLISGLTRSVENVQDRRFTNNSCIPMNVGSIAWRTTWTAGVTGNVGYGDYIGVSVTGNVSEEETVTLGPWVVPPGQTLVITRGAIMETTTHTGIAEFRTQFTFWSFRQGRGVVTEKKQVGIDFQQNLEGTPLNCTPTPVPTNTPLPTPTATLCPNPSGLGYPSAPCQGYATRIKAASFVTHASPCPCRKTRVGASL